MGAIVLVPLLLAGMLGLQMTTVPSGAAQTMTVVPGDTMSIQGSDIECVVPTTSPVSIVCFLTSHGGLQANSYAIRSAERDVGIIRATGDHRVLFRASNPAVAGAPAGTSARQPLSLALATHEYVVVGGTHIVCQSGAAAHGRLQTFGCGAYSTSSRSSYYVAGSYATTISDQNAGILRVGKGGAESLVAYEKQP